ncbi:S-adenosylmethionine sensor upstream of mTORC1 isoform 2-T2 [Menidia menidia]
MNPRDNVETGETENLSELCCVPIPTEVSYTQEQDVLSGVVKNVHRKLRRKYREVGDFDKIWREHCEDERTLSEYALAMKNLADNHWTKKCDGEGRIEWCRSVSQEYFLDGGMKRMLEKDEKSAALSMGPTVGSVSAQACSTIPSSISHLGKIRLLDVGSCFNPFLKFDEFLTVGIDIVPAVESVYKCDFLNLQLQQPLQLAGDAVDAFLRQLHNPIDALPAQLFHVVVFSLLLSYFPSPYQRWICCKKAHELLELHGLLLIITPDSSHQNRHALMMRSWRVAVESLGFKRYKTSTPTRRRTAPTCRPRRAPTWRTTSWPGASASCPTPRTTPTPGRARAAPSRASTSWRIPFCSRVKSKPAPIIPPPPSLPPPSQPSSGQPSPPPLLLRCQNLNPLHSSPSPAPSSPKQKQKKNAVCTVRKREVYRLFLIARLS